MANKPRSANQGYLGVLRRMHGKGAQATDADISAVLARLSKTPDGDALLSWIQHQTLGQVLPDDASEGALRASEARKSFATRIFNLLDRGLSRDATG